MQTELLKAVEEAIAVSTPPPANETETCDRIIYPLLHAAGYSRLEIRSQDRDAAGQKPDYTLLPDSPEHTWFLEAKAWSVSLADSHAQQAINYANTAGKRWVVLTNGRVWRIYDNHIKGTAEGMLSAQFALKDESFVSFLEAISQSSVTRGKLEAFVTNQRLYSVLASQIKKQDSDVVKAVGKVIRRIQGLRDVPDAEIVAFFRDRECPPLGSEPPPVPPAVAPTSGAIPPNLHAPTSSGLRLSEITKDQVTHKRPVTLRLSDGTVIQGTKWDALTVQLAKYVLQKELLSQIPFFITPRSKTPCVALAESPESAKMHRPFVVPAAGKRFVVKMNYSAWGHIGMWKAILSASGLSEQDCELSVEA